MSWWGQLSSTYTKLRKPVNKPAPNTGWATKAMKGQKDTRTTEVQNNNYPGGYGSTSLTLMLHTCFPPPPQTEKKNLHVGLSLEKGEEMGLKLQRKERSAD